MKLRSMVLACSPLLLLPASAAVAQTLDQRRAEIKERLLRGEDDEDQADDEDAAADDESADDEDAADDDASADDEGSDDEADDADDADDDDDALVDDDDAVIDQDDRDELREDLRRRLEDD